MKTLKNKLLGILMLVSVSTFVSAQAFFESDIKPDSTNNAYGLFISNTVEQSFIGYEYHDHGNHNHYRIALRPSSLPGGKGAFVGQTGQLAVGTEDPCARLVDPSIMLSIEGGALKIDNALWDVESDKRLKKNITLLKNSTEKFMNINFYRFEYEGRDGIQYGIIAQEVKKDFPHSVGSFKKHGEEYLSFNPNNLFFTGMKVIQENSKEIIAQDEQIQALEVENQQLRSALEAERRRNEQQQSRLDAIEAALANQGIDLPHSNREVQAEPANTSIHIQTQGNQPSLEQNIPNPFSRFTTIPYSLPDNTQTATLVIRDMTGKTIAKHILPTQKGAGKIEVDIEDTQLRGGTFTYSLYINKALIDTKKMVLSSK